MRDEPLSKRALGRWPGIFGGTRRSFPSASQQAWALSDVRRQGPLSLRRPGRPGNLDLQPLWGWRWARAGSAFLRVDFRSAALAAERQVGQAVEAAPQREPRPPEQKQRELLALWKRAQPISAEDPAGKYLNRRLGLTTYPKVLRFLPR